MNNRLVDLVRFLLTSRMSSREIGASLGLSKTTVDRYRRIMVARGDTWEKLSELSGRALDVLFNRGRRESGKHRPDFDEFETLLREPGVTLFRLWEEYRAALGPNAVGYAQCARLYSRHRSARQIVMRRTHEPGRLAFVDYSGKRPHYIDRATGEAVAVELFVGVLGASSYTFVCCTATQALPDWLDANTRMLEFFGGAPQAIVPDNLRSGVTKAGAEPVIQRHYLEWARHHNLAILPARPGRPRDKGLVEGAVLIAQRLILPELAKQRFFSLAEVDAAVAQLLTRLNARPFQKRSGSRTSEFQRIETPALQPLPATRFVYHQWIAKQTVPPDYHAAVNGHFYSVPHSLVGRRVEARVSSTHVEVFCDGECVARHPRKTAKGGHTTVPEHQTDAHRSQGERTPEHLLAWAKTVGPHTSRVMERQFRQKVPLQGLPAASALRNLARACSPEDLEAAAGRALKLRVPNPTGVRRQLAGSVGADPFPNASPRTVPLRIKGRATRPAPPSGGASC